MIEAFLASLFFNSPVMYSETRCLASVIYHEARGEPLAGKKQVAKVVLNRVKSKRYPNHICGVVFQHKQFSGHTSLKYNNETLKLARSLLVSKIEVKFPKAMYYHTTDVKPYWSSWDKLTKVGVVGNHVFYSYRRKDG